MASSSGSSNDTGSNETDSSGTEEKDDIVDKSFNTWQQYLIKKHTFKDIFKELDDETIRTDSDYRKIIFLFKKISEIVQSTRGGRFTVGQVEDLIDYLFGFAQIFHFILTFSDNMNTSLEAYGELSGGNPEDLEDKLSNLNEEIDSLKEQLKINKERLLVSERNLLSAKFKNQELEIHLEEFRTKRDKPLMPIPEPLLETVQSKTERNKVPATLVVKNTEKSNCRDLLGEIKNKINIFNSGFRVNSININKQNDVVVTFPDRTDLEKFQSKLTECFQESITFNKVRPFLPKLIIYKIPSELKMENLLNNIVTQNSFISEGDIKILFPIKTKFGLNVVVEVKPAIFKQLGETADIFLGWGRCKVKEFFCIKKCSRCGEIGHTTKKCQKQTCTFCTGHECKGECQVGACSTCFIANSKFGFHYDIKHKAGFWNCPAIQSQVNGIQRRTTYG